MEARRGVCEQGGDREPNAGRGATSARDSATGKYRSRGAVTISTGARRPGACCSGDSVDRGAHMLGQRGVELAEPLGSRFVSSARTLASSPSA